MHLLDEVFAERYKEEYSEEATEHGAEEHLEEVHIKPEDIYGRESEYRSGHHHSRTCADTLDDDILAKTSILAQGAGHADGNDGDRNRGFEHLPDLEAEEGRRRGEEHRHQQAHGHRIRGDLKRLRVRTQKGFVHFPRFQLPMSVLGQTQVFVFFHLFLSVFRNTLYISAAGLRPWLPPWRCARHGGPPS